MKPVKKSNGKLVQMIMEHHNLTLLKLMQRCTTISVCQVSVLTADLWCLAKLYNFGQTLDDVLRYRAICRINKAVVQCCLLAELHLTFHKAME